MKRLGAIRWAAMIAGAAMWLGGAANAAAAPACGQTLTHDLKLKKNLNCSNSNGAGLVIGAHGVTIDLNGHRLIGGSSIEPGIDDTAGWNRLVIKDGELVDWGDAILIEDSTRPLVRDLVLRQGFGDVGVAIRNSVEPVVQRVRVRFASYGFSFDDNEDALVARSSFIGGPSADEYGGFLDESSTGVYRNISAEGAANGIFVQDATEGLTITDGRFVRNDEFGVRIENGLPFENNRYFVRESVARNNDGYGFFAMFQVKGKRNVASGNDTNCLNVPCKQD